MRVYYEGVTETLVDPDASLFSAVSQVSAGGRVPVFSSTPWCQAQSSRACASVCLDRTRTRRTRQKRTVDAQLLTHRLFASRVKNNCHQCVRLIYNRGRLYNSRKPSALHLPQYSTRTRSCLGGNSSETPHESSQEDEVMRSLMATHSASFRKPIVYRLMVSPARCE